MRPGLILAAFTAAVCLAQSDGSRGFVNQRVYSAKMLGNAPALKPLSFKPAKPSPVIPKLDRFPARKHGNVKFFPADPKMIVPLPKKPVDQKMLVLPKKPPVDDKMLIVPPSPRKK